MHARIALGLFLAAVTAAQAAAPVTEGDAAALAARIDRLERLLESRGLLDMLTQIEALQAQVSQLRGELEMQNHALNEIRARQRDLYTDLDQRLQRLEAGGTAAAPGTFGDSPAPAGEAAPPLETLSPLPQQEQAAGTREAQSALQLQTMEPEAQDPETGAPAPPGEPQVPAAIAETGALGPAAAAAPSDPVKARADYERAFTLLKQSRYDQAIEAFRDFLAEHGASEYADNAQYWLGETYYVTRDFENALGEYQRVVSEHADSQKLPDALLKIGFAQQELGRLDAARATLEDVVQRFPGTTVARLASERLNLIRSSAPAPDPAR